MDTNLLILLIEDDGDDIELLEDALRANGVCYNLFTLNDGSAALEHIRSEAARPDVIILDFNLPKVHGREVILGIKSSDWANIPLVVLTTSSSREDIDFSYRHGVVKFFTKPTTQAELAGIVNAIVAIAATAPNRPTRAPN